MGVNWMKSGQESAALAKHNEAEVEKRKEEQGKMFRFWLNRDEEGVQITFVDGDLSPEGFLLPNRFYEHQLKINGSWNNLFVCPEKTNPESGEKCPICEQGEVPSLVALFTVIDHRTFFSKDKTKQYKDRPKLFVAKSQTFEILNKIALKRGGLAGCSFDVFRTGEQAAAVGTMFDFIDKKPLEELKADPKYTIEWKDAKTNKVEKKLIFVPANYETEIVYRSGDDLRKLGFGSGKAGSQAVAPQVNSMKNAPPKAEGAEDAEFDDHL